MTEIEKNKKNEENSPKIKDLIQTGDVSIDVKDYGIAIEKFTCIFDIEPQNFRALFNLEVKYAIIGVNNKAFKYWKVCTVIKP